MEFQTNLRLLSEKTIFHNLSLRIPRSFSKINDRELSLLKSRLENLPNAIFKTIVLGAFVDSLGSSLIMSEISDSAVLEKLDNEFNNALTNAWDGSNPIRSQFTINDLPVVHYQIFNDQFVNIKIFILTLTAVQLDYIVSRDSYPDYQTLIESSLSTLRFVKQP